MGRLDLVCLLAIVLLVHSCVSIAWSFSWACTMVKPFVFLLYRMDRTSWDHTSGVAMKPSCFGECFVKRAGFMNDNFTFNRDTIMRFTNRFVSKEISEKVYNICTDNVTPTYCVTAFDVYQCIYENVYKSWDSRK
ncbi:AGAP012323-PA [Anopheles gambiae str. PEST]|uniref:AGAP012323-PA n=1 Tax=Anopheles gambiae TaxID=7165 RepID=Q5TN65_ANOGA|nr:AGAP012323-PA [Anopheles gambiae str. PEST]